jgi:uncharacterized membrane protein YbhN (UPF0104 family)
MVVNLKDSSSAAVLPRPRSRQGLWLRLFVSTAILALLVPRIDPHALAPGDPDLTMLAYVSACVVMIGIGLVLSAWRWQRVLETLDVPVRMGDLISHHLAGQFVGNFLPSTIGGDVLRVYRLGMRIGWETSFSSVVLERLTGWVVLPVLSLTALAAQPSLLQLGLATRLAFALSIGTLVLLGLVIAAGASPRLAGRFSQRTGVVGFIGEVHVGLGRLRHQPSGTLRILIAAVIYQLSTVVTVYLATQALGLDVPFGWALAFAPVVAIAQVLPFSLNGLGLREGALVIFLGPLGVSAAQCVAVGLLLHATTLLVSLCGAPSFAFGAKSRSQVI